MGEGEGKARHSLNFQICFEYINWNRISLGILNPTNINYIATTFKKKKNNNKMAASISDTAWNLAFKMFIWKFLNKFVFVNPLLSVQCLLYLPPIVHANKECKQYIGKKETQMTHYLPKIFLTQTSPLLLNICLLVSLVFMCIVLTGFPGCFAYELTAEETPVWRHDWLYIIVP